MSPISGESNSIATGAVSQYEPIRIKRSLISYSMRLCFLAMVVLNSGCCNFPSMTNGPRFIDQAFVCYRDKVWAQRAYNLQYGDCSRAFRDHFQRGFVEGYCSVCNGGEGYVPATPPQDYWSYEFQSPEGAECVNAYFEGYPLGAKAAKTRGIDNYHDVYVSRMIDAAIKQDKTQMTLPSDVTIVASVDAEQDYNSDSNDLPDSKSKGDSNSGSKKSNLLFQDQ